MDSSLLTLRVRVLAGLCGIILLAGCSLVLDTEECSTDADCDFANSPRMQCAGNECVAAPTQQALVPATIEHDTTLNPTSSWILRGVVVAASATLTIEPATQIEIRTGSAIVLICGGDINGIDGRDELTIFNDFDADCG